MNFNKELYMAYRKAAGRQEKEGWFDVTRFPNGLYCFATKQWLGDNGEIDNHPLLNKKFKKKSSCETYIMDSVCIHWYNGYYYHASLRDSNNSHATVMIGNINCQEDWVLKNIGDFNSDWELVD